MGVCVCVGGVGVLNHAQCTVIIVEMPPIENLLYGILIFIGSTNLVK